MPDPIQHGLQTIGGSAVGRDAAIVCADVLVYALAAVWIVVVARRYATLTMATLARTVILAVVAYAASKVLGALISDPRPYILEHIRPITPIAHDNGFPSDHTLLAALLTASLYWIDRRFVGPFAVAVVLVMAGRLAIAAHHTLDVVGSGLIVGAALLLVTALPLPPGLRRSLVSRPKTETSARAR